MSQPKLSDLHTCQLLKLYYKLYRNKLPRYFDNFLSEFGIHNQALRNDLIRLLAIRYQFGKMDAKYQKHFTLGEPASLPYSTAYSPIYSGYINSLFFKLFKDSFCEILLQYR